MTDKPLLIIGLDAADKNLITDWALAGELPNFRSLADTAIWGDIKNPYGLEAGSCWPAFYFGLSPSKTGQYDGSRQFDSSTYDHIAFRPIKSPYPPIWETLSRAGRLCAVIDAPYSYSGDFINGMKVIDRGAHVPAGGGNDITFRTHPADLADEIISRFGPDPAGGRISDDFSVSDSGAIRHFRDVYLKRVKNKTDLLLHYWRQRKWDLFFSVFTEAHCVGHRCWHIHDRNHPDYDARIAQAVGDPIKDIYVALDEAVGRIVENTRREARLLVYLSHGMGPGYSGTRLLDRILMRLENQQPVRLDGTALQALRWAWRSMPKSLRKQLMAVRKRVSHDGFQPNRCGRRFFEVFANDRTAGIRINLEGREPRGMIRPGAEYEAVCESLMADLSEIINAETGSPVVQEVIRTAEHYRGERIMLLPDLLVTWNRSAPINVVSSPKIGQVDKGGLINMRSGDHEPVGRFYGVAPDWSHRSLIGRVRVEDFAPTILRLFGIDKAEGDGVPIEALLTPNPTTTVEGIDACPASQS